MKTARIIALLVLTASCSNTGAPYPKTVRGPSTPRFEAVANLLSTARVKGVSCADERPFDPLHNIAPDSHDYAIPDARVCDLPNGQRLYVIVYDTRLHRMQAFEHGEVNLNLCSLVTSAPGRSEPWNALVAANWRVATPGSAETLADLRAAFGGLPEPEALSCQFRA